ncbi:hypothetical protein MZM54_21180 [[Brevibacterium] frigoritolerans]|nr:hypothetical protein [Peribacillus frigoritolerans]
MVTIIHKRPHEMNAILFEPEKSCPLRAAQALDNGRYETAKEKRRPHGAKSAKEAPRPPAESEWLEWKSTFKVYKPRKKVKT